MLRFIVLGEIPGTHISLTFFQVLLLLGGFYGLILLRREQRQLRQPGSSQTDKAVND